MFHEQGNGSVMSTGTDRRQFTKAECPHVRQRTVLLTLSEFFGRKWHALILFQLRAESASFSDLKREIDGISGKMLAESLDVLVGEYGVVDRRELDDSANRVEYSLSAAGHALVPVLLALQEWADDHLQLESHE